MPSRAALLVALSAATLALSPVDESCSLNGALVRGACVCARGWAGAACARLALRPAAPDAGLQLPGASTWGGLPVRGADGAWSLFASLFADGCGVDSWQPNSQVVRAVPADARAAPGGAWVLAPGAPVSPAFTHSPEARARADGSVVVPVIFADGVAPCANCSGGRTGSGAGCGAGGGWVPGTRFFGDWGTLEAPTPVGPWTRTRRGSCAAGAADAVPGCPANGNDLNPSVAEAPDGSLLMVWRSIDWASKGVSYLCTATAPSWAGPWAYNTSNLFPAAAGIHVEDPFLWRDAASGTWHLLAHADAGGDQGGAAGVHGFSRDGRDWRLSPGNAFGAGVELLNGTVVRTRHRERPKLVLGEDGAPSFLFSAVVWGDEAGDRSVTFVAPVG